MRFLEVLLVLNVCVITSAHGLLNDSQPDLIERFGRPAAESSNQTFGSRKCVFVHGEWEIHAFLLDERCHMISYFKLADRLRRGLPTAVFKTERWKTLEGRPLGWGDPGVRPEPGKPGNFPSLPL